MADATKSTPVLRCVNCGNIVDREILIHRQLQQEGVRVSPAHHKARGKTGPRGRYDWAKNRLLRQPIERGSDE